MKGAGRGLVTALSREILSLRRQPDRAAVHSVREGLVVINAISSDLQGQFEPEHLALKYATVVKCRQMPPQRFHVIDYIVAALKYLWKSMS